MSLIYRFPNNFVVDTATQEYFVEREKFVGDKIMPFTPVMAQKVIWDVRDNERGMTAPHVLGTDPKVGTRQSSKLKEYDPIYFKETDPIREDELLRARALGTIAGVVDLHQLIGQVIRDREDKNFIRAESLRWQAAQGELHINENGVVVDEVFPVQHFYTLIDYDDLPNATPLKDDNAAALMFRGTGASAKGAVCYLNQTTLNWRLENTNDEDLRGYRNQNFLSVTFSLEELNKIQIARGLWTFELYDEGRINEDGDFETFIPDGVEIIFGKRPAGQLIMDVVMTPSMHRQTKEGLPAPGMFTIVEVNGQPNPGVVEVSSAALGAHKNPVVEITGGWYGGPRPRYPRSIIVKHVKLS
jgi:hypothetical protein